MENKDFEEIIEYIKHNLTLSLNTKTEYGPCEVLVAELWFGHDIIDSAEVTLPTKD